MFDRGDLIIINAAQVATPTGSSARKGHQQMNDLRIVENGAVVVIAGEIHYVGPMSGLPQEFRDIAGEAMAEMEGGQSKQECSSGCPDRSSQVHIGESRRCRVIDARGRAVVPGFVDSHTHLVFGGFREEEFSWRMRGDSYMSIMERGGGIHSTMTATRNASYDELVCTALDRLDRMFALGVTTVEGKSGYGMDCKTELGQLEAMKSLRERHPIDIVSTFMGAHATPAEYKGREDEFLDYIIKEVMPQVKTFDLAEFCDIFCEKGVFDIGQSRRYLEAARAAGFKLKMHADEIVDIGGAALAAELGAVSADHLLKASADGIRRMADSGVVATLLPCTAFCLKEEFADARGMIDAGCAVALATDLNPGSSFTSSIPLTFALACIYMKMSPEEALTALTLNGAAAVDRADRIGSIEKGKAADMAILDFPSYKFLPYHAGMNIVRTVIKKGIPYTNQTLKNT